MGKGGVGGGHAKVDEEDEAKSDMFGSMCACVFTIRAYSVHAPRARTHTHTHDMLGSRAMLPEETPEEEEEEERRRRRQNDSTYYL